ncbi:MAG: protein kinase [Rhodothermales bacterium]|nr:protein kinase [Rhodothermales bacterium]
MKVLDPERVESIFADVVDLPGEERLRALDNACRADQDLKAEILDLIKAHEEAIRFFDDLGPIFPSDSLSEVLDDDQRVDPYGLLGKMVSHFRVEEHLGGGGMGVVYRAHDANLPRDVALKFLPPEMSRDESAVSRFKHEVNAASSLNHPNIAVVHEVGRLDDGQLFVAMAYYDGETLKKKIDRGPLPVARVIDYGIGITAGLAEAHENGIVHRDVKPANVMVTRRGHIRLLDFGVAKVASQSTLTPQGSIVGTPGYMAPEQIRGEGVDARTDVWATGLLLYEMLTGVHPFLAEHQQATIYQVLNVDPPAIALNRPDVPDGLVDVISRCLVKDRSERLQSVEELGNELRKLKEPRPLPESPGSPEPVSWLDRATDRMMRMAWPGKMAAVLLSLFVLTLAVDNLIDSCTLPPAEPVDLAVLPFVNVGADSMLVNGLYQAITSSLVRLEGRSGGLSVVPTDDILYREVSSPQGAAEKFGVDLVIRPSAQDATDELLVQLDLVEFPDARVADSRLLRIPYSDIGRLQEEVVVGLAGLLGLYVDLDVLDELSVGSTAVSDAYLEYTRARGYLFESEDEANVDAAIDLLKAAVSEDDTYAIAHAALGEAYLQKYKLTRDAQFIDLAVQHGTRARDLNKDLAPARIALGLTYLERGEIDNAENEFIRAQSLLPNSAAVHYNLGKIYGLRDQVIKAEQYYQKAIELKPDYWQYNNGLGIFYHYEGRHEEAASCFRRVIELRPDNPWGYNNLGAQYRELGRWEDAMAQFIYATEVDTNTTSAVAFANDNIARLYYSHRDFEQAAHWFERAISVQELDYDSWDQLGNAYWKTEREEEALDAWWRVIGLASDRLEINPNDRNALNYIAEAYAKLGQPDLARSAMYHLLSLERIQPSDLVVAAKVHEILARRDSALYYVEQALDRGATLEDIEVSIWLDDLRISDGYKRLTNDRRS